MTNNTKEFGKIYSKEILDTILDVVPGSIYWKDTEGRYLGFNQEQLKMAGLNAKDIFGKTDYDMPWQKQADDIYGLDLKAIKSKQTVTSEELASLPSGEIRTYLSKKKPIIKDNRVVGIVGISIDVTAEKEAERLRLEKLRLEKAISAGIIEGILDLVPASIYWKDIEGRYLGFNQEQLKISGLSENDILGKTDYDMPWHANAKEVRRLDRQAMQTRATINSEEVGRQMDGQIRTYLSKKKPIIADDQVIGVIGISIDITAEKEAEHLKLEKLRLEKAVSDEKTKLLQKQVTTLRSQAHTIAHELKTPLGAISLNTKGIRQMAKAENDAAKQERLERIYNNISAEISKTRMFIDIILGNVKDLGQVALDNINIMECIEAAVERFPYEDEAEKAKVKLLDINDFVFYGNHELMVHVLFNLIKNALYFITQVHKGEISIWTTHDNKFNYLHFKDTAKGMSDKELKLIFEEFYTGTDIGTGVGLFFCRRVMQLFGGDIMCQAKLGEYTEFIMSFPKLEKQQS